MQFSKQLSGKFVFVLFGATGDLALNKLLPALYNAVRFNPSLAQGHFICLGRSITDEDKYFATVKSYIEKVSQTDFDADIWQKFRSLFSFLKLDAQTAADFDILKRRIEALQPDVKIYYLSTSPKIFPDIVHHLTRTSLNEGNTRIVLEKPLGSNLSAAQKINKIVQNAFPEDQIYRIDHYLGKESVQNLMALRFGNRFLEPLWNRIHIRSVQITIAEDIGISSRGAFYEDIGALRDMMQNHLLQLLCFIAMEPPYALTPDAIRDEKLKILRSIPLYTHDEALKNTIFGQYAEGMINGQAVPAYLKEAEVKENSKTETYIAAKFLVSNWRWAGVPFYLRTGKRLPKKLAEIVISFRSVPHNIFMPPLNAEAPNKLVINLQPHDDMRLYMAAKPPGATSQLQQVSLNLNFTKQLNQRRPSAYERLLCDIIRGDLSLFVRQDELEEAWKIMTPLLELKEKNPDILEAYRAGSWGPESSHVLLEKDRAKWHEEQ
ncbi:MAG: glucose-6-phosphate dehydrogenase [Pseudomonadota bacterium]